MLIAVALLTAAVAATVQPAPATAVPEVAARLLGCRAIADDQQRLRCFDAAAAQFSQAQQAGTVTVVDREQIRRTRRSLFGFSLPERGLLGRREGEPEEKEIRTTLASVGGGAGGQVQFTLADGSVWRTIDGRLVSPRRGDAVIVRKGALGSYFLTSFGRSVRVSRIR